ncbi:hypothetical protein ACFLT8_05225 [Chloroflexota bacterium]
MSQRLDKVKLVKGRKWERMDPLDNIGVSTYTLIKDAIQEGKNELAKDLTDYLWFWEVKFLRDINIDVGSHGFPEWVREKYGEYAEFDHQKDSMIRSGSWGLPFTEKPVVKKRDQSPYDYTMGYARRMSKVHRMGRNDGVGGFIIEEYPDRYEFIWDPCYTGGRPRRGDPNSNTPPRTGPPYYYNGTQVPHPWTWGKTGVSGFCIHCAWIHNIADVEQRGYLQWVTGYPDDPFKPCTYIAYKDVDWIPEEYYTRIGKTKPKVTSKAPKPKDTNKLIKVTHSSELGPDFIPTVTLLKNAIDAGNKAAALRLVNDLNVGCMTYYGAGPWPFMDLIVEKYGYNELYHALRWIYSPYNPPPAPDEPRPTKATIPSAEERARKAALWGRSAGSGPNWESSVRIVDEPDRIVMELDPCGSGGRALMTIDKVDDSISAVAKRLPWMGRLERGPLTGPPRNYKVTTVSHPVAWGKVGIPHVCLRCCVHIDVAAVARSGYLTEIVERPENATDPTCRWFFYKELDDIPEKYYTRIGAKKPPRQRRKRQK